MVKLTESPLTQERDSFFDSLKFILTAMEAMYSLFLFICLLLCLPSILVSSNIFGRICLYLLLLFLSVFISRSQIIRFLVNRANFIKGKRKRMQNE